ncbi:hypothetical protein J802_4517, partial [Acinetobacter baumannii 45002_9]
MEYKTKFCHCDQSETFLALLHIRPCHFWYI